MNVQLALEPGLIRQGMESYLAGQSVRSQLFSPSSSELPVDVFVTDDVKSMQHLALMNVPVVVCTKFMQRSDLLNALRQGAMACVSIQSNFQHLRMAIEHAHAKRPYLCPTLSTLLCQAKSTGICGELTQRELDVINWIALGYSTKQVGRKLGLSPHTVETHKRNIMQKIGARKVTELTRYALTLELAAWQETSLI
jgi:DNA-binding NarL/FixJ family response regulator